MHINVLVCHENASEGIWTCVFIICLCFLRSQSIADVIRKRYGDRALKNVRKFERLDFSGLKMSTGY